MSETANSGGAKSYGNVPRETLKSVQGLELLQGMIDGRYPGPPIAELLDFGVTELGPGRAVFTARPGRQHYNPSGTVHGGYAATLIDSATGCAVQTRLPARIGYGTIELKVNYVRRIDETTGRLLCTGNVIHAEQSGHRGDARSTAVGLR